MSNGHAGLGGVEIKQDEGIYGLAVGQSWTSADGWTTLAIGLGDKRIAYLDMDHDDARQLAALLLEAAGNEDLAKAIPADMARREAKATAREAAYEKLRVVQQSAETAFKEAAASQMKAYLDTVKQAEHEYTEATGEHMRTFRSINLEAPLTGEPPF